MKIGLLSPGPQDATSWYRGVLPWCELAKQRRHTIEIVAEIKQWHDFAGFDAVVAQRPMLPPHLELVERAFKLNIPIIVDFDDDQLHLPPWNGMFHVFERPEAKESAIACARLATVITVSTQKLADMWSKFNPNVVVIPNAWPDRVLKTPDLSKIPGRDHLVAWRSTTSQRGDHHLFPDALSRLVKETNVKFLSLGESAFFEDNLPADRVTKVPWLETLEYFNLLRQINPTVCLKPMQEHTFNHAKSNIAWMESIYTGAVCVAPDWKEWRVPGCLRYNSQKSFADTVMEAVTMPEADRIKLVKEGWAYIEKNLLLSKVNQTRQAILERL